MYAHSSKNINYIKRQATKTSLYTKARLDFLDVLSECYR